jgi:hypothetical protein
MWEDEMATSYKIERVISKGKNGRQMITARFNKKSVTRHIVDGLGRHPDDSIPALHARLHKNVSDLQLRLTFLNARIAATEKKLIETPDDVELKLQHVLDGEKLANTQVALNFATSVLDKLLESDPLTVRYV